MAENQNPATSTAANADQPGRPYYESLRNTLRQTLDKKKRLDDQLAKIEDEIHKNEGIYLEETAGSGNIVRGFDGWVKGVAVGGRGGDDRRRGRVRDEDRIFSRSSVSWMRAQDQSDSATPSHAPTPTGSIPASLSRAESQSGATGGASKAGNKKKRPTEKDEEEDSKSAKRGKITYSRD